MYGNGVVQDSRTLEGGIEAEVDGPGEWIESIVDT